MHFKKYFELLFERNVEIESIKYETIQINLNQVLILIS